MNRYYRYLALMLACFTFQDAYAVRVKPCDDKENLEDEASTGVKKRKVDLEADSDDEADDVNVIPEAPFQFDPEEEEETRGPSSIASSEEKEDEELDAEIAKLMDLRIATVQVIERPSTPMNQFFRIPEIERSYRNNAPVDLTYENH